MDINKGDSKGVTSLHYAAQYNKTGAMKILLDRGVDINQGDNKGATPLHYAAQHNKTEAMNILLDKDGIEVNQADVNKKTPLRYAIVYGRTKAMNILLGRVDINQGDNDGAALLQISAIHGKLKDIKLLLANGENINQIGPNNKTLFENVADNLSKTKSNEPPIEEKLLPIYREKFAKILLTIVRYKNFDPGNTDISTILTSVIEVLGENNIKINIIAECANGSSLALIKHLERGKNISDINQELVEKYGAQMRDSFNDSKEEREKWDKFKVADETPLSAAAIAGNTHIVEYLLNEKDDNPNILINQGDSSILYGVCKEIEWINGELKSNKDNSNQKNEDESGQNSDQNKLTQDTEINLEKSLKNYLGIADILIAKGADIKDKKSIEYLATTKNKDDNTKTIATTKNNDDNIKTIEEYQQEITDERNKNGKTPYAILSSVYKENLGQFVHLNIALLTENQEIQKKENTQLSEKLSEVRTENDDLRTDLDDLKAQFAEMQKSLLKLSEASNKRTAGEMDGQGSNDKKKRPKTIAGKVKVTALKLAPQQGLE